MKECKSCKNMKPLAEYYKRGGKRSGTQQECKVCAAKRAREYKQKMRDKVSAYKLGVGCEVCGFVPEHPCQLDLDHIDPDTKEYKGSHKAYDAGWSWERIVLELRKCNVLCKNCHALRTYKEGHWKNEYTTVRMRQSSAQ